MGACTFIQAADGKSAAEAFSSAVKEAQYDRGHGGYTGTIAEKRSFVEIKVPDGEDPRKFAEKLMGDDDERVRDKWGPAGCVELRKGRWLFFGWASS